MSKYFKPSKAGTKPAPAAALSKSVKIEESKLSMTAIEEQNELGDESMEATSSMQLTESSSLLKVKTEEQEDDEEEATPPPKPAPSFNGALDHFRHAPTKSSTPADTIVSTLRRSVRTEAKRTIKYETKADPDSSSEPTSSSDSSAPAKKKRKRAPSSYAPPSKYAHLSGIPDALDSNLITLFVGLNPGLKTAETGHAYSAPSNLFWKLLHWSGITPDMRRPATDDMLLPSLYSLGNTNLVSRPTKDQAELSRSEMNANVERLEEKVRIWRPESVTIVGKGIWESVFKEKMVRGLGKNDGFAFGWQELRLGKTEEWEGSRCYVTMSTSGLVVMPMEEKRRVFGELGEWINKRREERGETAPKAIVEMKVEEMVEAMVEAKVEAKVEDVETVGIVEAAVESVSLKNEIVHTAT